MTWRFFWQVGCKRPSRKRHDIPDRRKHILCLREFLPLLALPLCVIFPARLTCSTCDCRRPVRRRLRLVWSMSHKGRNFSRGRFRTTGSQRSRNKDFHTCSIESMRFIAPVAYGTASIPGRVDNLAGFCRISHCLCYVEASQSMV
jgi:hypothetical protein